MKKLLLLFFSLCLFVAKVDAIKCYDGIIEVDDSNFSCSDISGDTVSFYHNGEDYSKYFSLSKNKKRINIVDKSITFDSSLALGVIEIVDGDNKTFVNIKNPSYVETTTTTTITEKPKIIYNVLLDSKDGDKIVKKSCEVTKVGETCSVTLPNLDKDNFNGWGTSDTCKEGATGTINVSKDITYFACYNIDFSTTTKNNEIELYLDSLKLFNENDESDIKFGNFNIKKFEYSFKVLNEVENIKVEASSDENVKISISGNKNLIVGDNEILITLKDDKNNKSVYKLNVYRLEEGESITNINYLSNLVVDAYNINFDKNQFVYTITIDKDTNRLELLEPIAENLENTIEIIGNENLENGSSIKINVTSEDGYNTVYTINIVKEKDFSLLIIISLSLVILLAIILIILIIVKIKQNKKNKKTTSKKEEIEVLKI